ncbi:MAG: polysaccharide biosynthesis/export family protein [Pseudomonadales bacterium]|nr:polysaccharide biosynthesis/export family protein [Pseudomonadales bacterium]
MKRILGLLLVLGLSACTTVREYPEIKSYQPSSEESAYVIGAFDQITVNVWKNEDLSVDVPVRPDGSISVPLVGDVKAEGFTATQLSEKLTEELSNFVRTPQVTVIVTEAVSSAFLRRVRITGAINNPTSVPYSKGMTVLDIVLLAGGLTDFADANGAKLYRRTESGTEIYPIYLEDILESGDLRSNYEMNPSDVLTVPESNF